MTLANSRVPAGEKIVARLELPIDRAYGGGQFAAFVGLYAPGTGINDWKASADFGWDGLSGKQVLELVPPARLAPGKYEVRLYPERFAPEAQVVLPIEIQFARLPNALIVEKSAFGPGEPIGVAVRLPANRALLGAQLRAELLPEGSGNATMDSLGTFWYSESVQSADESRRHTFDRSLPPGRYEIRLYFDRGNDYLLDAVRLIVASSLAQAAAINAHSPRETAPAPQVLAAEERTEIVKEPDGRETTVWSRDYPAVDGRRVVAEDSEGGFAEFVLSRDGAISGMAVTQERETVTFERDAAGDSLWIGDHEGELLVAETTPDGSGEADTRVAVESMLDGSTAEIDAHGTLSYSDGFGTVTRISTAPDGSTETVHTDDEGNHVVVQRDATGDVRSVKSWRLHESEPGREYYEKVVNGTEWESLRPLEKARFANLESSERARVDIEHLTALRKEAGEQRDRAERAERAAREAGRDREFKRQQAEFAAAEAEREKAEADIRRREERQQQLADAYSKAEQLERDYQHARARGDVVEVARTQALLDAHAEASSEIFRFTEEEQRDLNRDSKLRQDLGDRVNQLTENAAAGDLAAAAKSGEAIAAIADSTMVSLAAGYSAEFRRNVQARDRAAEDEEIRARHRLAVIDQISQDPSLTERERHILAEQRLLASGKYAGAATLRDRTAALQAVAGVADATQLVAGGALANGALKLARGAAAVGRASGRFATAVAPETANAVSEATSALARTTAGGARIVASVTADGARALGASGIQVAEQVIGRRAVSLASDVASGVGTASWKAAQVALTDVGDAAQALRARVSQRAGAGLGDAVGTLGRVDSEAGTLLGAPGRPRAGDTVSAAAPQPGGAAVGSFDQPAFDEVRARARAGRVEAEREMERLLADGKSIGSADVGAISSRILNDMHADALNDMIREARAIGLSDARIGGAVGDPGRLGAGQYGRALRSLQGEILTHQGIELIQSADSANSVRQLAVRARTGAMQRQDVAQLQGMLVAAARQGEEPFSRLARQGRIHSLDGFQPLLSEGDIAALRRAAEQNRLGTRIDEIRAAETVLPETQRLARVDIERAMREAGAADTRILTRAELEAPPARAGPARRPPAGGRVSQGDLAGPDEPTSVLTGDPVLDAPRPRPAPKSGGQSKIAGPDEPTSVYPEPPRRPGAVPLRAEELTPEDLARWGDETGAAHQRPPPLRPMRRNAEYADEVAEFLSRIDARRPGELAAVAVRDAALVQRQQLVGEFDFSGLQRPIRRQQRNLEIGDVPRRRFVEGDTHYLESVMPRRFVATQKEVDPRLINRYVQQMLDGEFPAVYRGKRPVEVVWTEDGLIKDGHHRTIAATIVHRLTGRPIFIGPNAIIPKAHLRILKAPAGSPALPTLRDDRPWANVAVRHADRRATARFDEG